jgi:PhoPQ-activated pathogenicity-related protein
MTLVSRTFPAFGRAGFSLLSVLLILLVKASFSLSAQQPLESYVRNEDSGFKWDLLRSTNRGNATVHLLSFHSQTWRGNPWKHQLLVIIPKTLNNPGHAFLYITGSVKPESQLPLLLPLAESGSTMVAALCDVPNQPLFGRSEDALIAYSLDQYLKTKDKSWPVLFPMVKSAVKAMDSLQAFATEQKIGSPTNFVVSGASKRGWTTWLTAAVDKRVTALAPMVFDILNMKQQVQWAEKMYGRQSEEIQDYVDFNLIAKMDDPAVAEVRNWIDPYSYRDRYTMPKLVLLGSNDPYWVVDSLRHYWAELPAQKLVFQTPNAGHNLGGGAEAQQTLAAWYHHLTHKKPLPTLDWNISNVSNRAENATATIRATASDEADWLLWTSTSPDRDFRNDRWTSKPLAKGKEISANIPAPQSGFTAFFLQGNFTAANGKKFPLSTEARVVPDGPPAR